jgi:hypothetical protein
MKKLLVLFLFCLVGVNIFDSCDQVTPTHMMTIFLVMPGGFTVGTVPDAVEIKMKNLTTGREFSVKADATGKAEIELAEGNYSLSSSFSLKVDNVEYTFNANVSEFMLTNPSSAILNLTLAKNTGGFVIKEVYFAGSKTPDAKSYYDDQFHEIYNNTTDTLFADGLCLGVLEQTSTNPNVWVNTDGSFMDQLPITFHVWIVPGTGKQHPVYPGKSIVIAMDGINHKSDPNGNPNSPVNLGNADWETYVDVAGKDLDAPGVPNLTMMYTTSASMYDWIHSVFGAAVVIFRLPTPWATYVADANNFKTKPGSTSSTKYFMIDKKYVIDGVEIVRAETDKRYKRLQNDLDAGYTYLDGGTYCSKSIRRKAKMIVNNRVIYQDTNNSTNDFLHDLVPTPGVNPTSVEK